MRRRELLRLGAAGIAAVGARTFGVARAEQAPGSGQGPQPPRPPAVEQVADIPRMPAEDWTEPWIWRPAEWPNRSLALHVVGNAHPPRAASPGNRFTPLYSFNGSSPGPTIRMRGDERLRVTMRNHLGASFGRVPKGPAPDPFEQRPEVMKKAFCGILQAAGRSCDSPADLRTISEHFHNLFQDMPVTLVDTRCLASHVNVPHGSHATNLHTHGLHVEPGVNANGTMGDNTHLRIFSLADGDARKRMGGAACRPHGQDERVGEVDYEIALGDVQRSRRLRNGGPRQLHAPGTHWYHPHAHGSTADQVSSGLAGFLIVEGDVDDAINQAMTGAARPDPCAKTGQYDYRERLMMIQRVEVFSLDADAGPRQMQGRVAPPTAINGNFSPTTIFMRPGAVERWRVLNASVDGRGFKKFMVLEGQFVFNDRQLWRVVAPAQDGAPRTLAPATRQDVADATRQLFQLSFDGITLMDVEGGRARHTIRDLSKQNPGTRNPLDRQPAPGVDAARAMLQNVEDCYRDGDSLRNLFVRPNEIFLANANRADVFFKAPIDAAGKVYTIFAQEFPLVTDNFQQRLQFGIAQGKPGFTGANPSPVDVVVGYIKVAGAPVPGGDFDVMSLRDTLPPVPPFLLPVEDEELRVPASEAARRRVPAGSFRTRVVSYSGYGPTDFPLIDVPEQFAKAKPELKGLLWDEIDGAQILLPPFTRTMAVNGAFDLALHADPPPPEKFGHHDPHAPKALIDTSEEWVLYNCSVSLWSHTDKARFKQPGQYGTHYRAYPIGRAEGQERFAKDPEFQITAKGADHPFHIHVNPCWVTRIDVPDEHGRLHNILDAPRWMDTVSIPRGGRVVFRSRFADYVGRWVNHCHILMHEDHGMMQMVETVPRVEDANYNPRTRVAAHAMPAHDVSTIYPPPSLELMYRQNLSFVDSNPELGQVFPGFPLDVPKLV